MRIRRQSYRRRRISRPREGQRVGKIPQIQQHKLVGLWRSVATIDPTNNIAAWLFRSDVLRLNTDAVLRAQFLAQTYGIVSLLLYFLTAKVLGWILSATQELALHGEKPTLFDRCSTPLQFQAVLFLTTQVKR